MRTCAQPGCESSVAHPQAVACEDHYETYQPPLVVDRFVPEWRRRRLAAVRPTGAREFAAVRDLTEATGR